ncbi:MAG: hypothetical protein HOD92_18270 [Deltaproteobacteria bacterium]|nr:hypothetical protein [Deltaproteobacteria bacterium]
MAIESVDYEIFQRLNNLFYDFWEESIVPYKIDIVHFDTVNADFKREAKKKIVIWKTD